MTRLEFNIFALANLLKAERISRREAGALLERCLGVAATAPEASDDHVDFAAAHALIHKKFDRMR